MTGPFTYSHSGNMHSLILYNNEEEEKIARDVVSKMVQHALVLDGTCT